MSIPCNRELITEQMTTLGIAERTLVSRVQFPLHAFRKARIHGVLDRHITLGQISKLAAELGTTSSELLATDPQQWEIPSPEQGAAADAEYLIPMLVGLPRRVSVVFLRRTLGWDRTRASEAIAAIPAALQGTGLKLHNANNSVLILPVARTTRETRRALAVLQTKSKGLTITHASTLTRIVEGTHTTQRDIGNTERAVIGALKNMGCIELDAKAAWRITDDLRAALIDLP